MIDRRSDGTATKVPRFPRNANHANVSRYGGRMNGRKRSGLNLRSMVEHSNKIAVKQPSRQESKAVKKETTSDLANTIPTLFSKENLRKFNIVWKVVNLPLGKRIGKKSKR